MNRWLDEERHTPTMRDHIIVVVLVVLAIVLGWLMIRKGASTLTPPNNPCAIEMYHDGTWEPICHTKDGLVPSGMSQDFAQWPTLWVHGAADTRTSACVEDDPCWNPQTMGNHQGAIK